MTTRQVAEYYEVTQEVIRDNIRRNREELEQNGMKFKKYSEIKDQVNCENFSHLKISRQGTNIFSKRAVLNIGMLLRDSEIAKRVRSALLDLEEITTNEQKTISIDKEKELLLNIITADKIQILSRILILKASIFNMFGKQYCKKLLKY